MLNFLSIFINITGHQNSKWMQNETSFLVCYIGRFDILIQQIRQIQAYHRKTYCDFNVILHSSKRHVVIQSWKQ